MGHRLIAHGLINLSGNYLVIKRSKIKRGIMNVYPEFWDIPGGRVESNELPRAAVVREVKEETNLVVRVKKIIYEDSQFDKGRDLVFTRLVYECKVVQENAVNILLDPEEHTDFYFLSSLGELTEKEKVVPYLKELIPNKGRMMV